MSRRITTCCVMGLLTVMQAHAAFHFADEDPNLLYLRAKGGSLSVDKLDPVYQFLFFWRTRNFVLASQNIKSASKSIANPAINQAGAFKTQYAIRMQRVIYERITLGLTGMLGKKGVDQKQFALYLIVTV